MSILSDGSIKRQIAAGNITISPFHEDNLQAASYDVTLDNIVLIPKKDVTADPFVKDDSLFERVTLDDNKPILMPPGSFILASTVERFEISNNLIARVEGKSSLGRLGIVIHQTAGFIDPGFMGNITLEITNSSPFLVYLYPGMMIAQIAFQYLDSAAVRPYGHNGRNSKYQNDRGPQTSRYYMNVKPGSIT
jgi:dCTP deaminase